MYEYKSSLAPFFTSYVDFKRSLGYKFQDISTPIVVRSGFLRKFFPHGAFTAPMKVTATGTVESLN